VAELFSDRYSDDETARLMELLERLPGHAESSDVH
jgi:hypothetical protein